MKKYEKLSTTPVGITPENDILSASQEKACRIDPINVEVSPFIEEDYTKEFNLSLD